MFYLLELENKYKDIKTLNILKKLKDFKLIKRFGISVYSLKNKNITQNLIHVIQLPSNIFDNRSDKYQKFFIKKFIEVHARSIFLQGAIF